jgi:acetate kinase
MKTLLERRASDARADLAVRVFARAIAKTIGAYAAVLGGLDALVFTGGIGEHAPAVREDACETLAFLGIALEPERNARSERTISSADSRTPVFVVPTDEDRMVAVHTARIVGE